MKTLNKVIDLFSLTLNIKIIKKNIKKLLISA